MDITAPSENPHGLNKDLIFTINNNLSTEPLKIDIFRTDTNEKIGSKIYSPATIIEVGVTGHITPSLKIEPLANNNTGIIFSNERAFPIKIVANEISSPERLISASKCSQNSNTSMNAMNEYIAPVGHSDKLEVAILSNGDAILEAEIRFCNRTAGDDWVKIITASRVHKGAVIFIINMNDLAQEIEEDTLNIDSYDEVKCKITNKTDEQIVVQYTIPIVKRRINSTRLCWKNKLGGIEYYTFPYLKRRMTKIDKNRVQTVNGGRITRAVVEKIIEIQSDFELKSTIEQIAEIAEATKVWLCEEGKDTPIIIIDSEITIEEATSTYLELKVSITQEEEFVA